MEPIQPNPTSSPNDKYKSQPVRFEDKGDHYELTFTDEFNTPTSGTMMNCRPYSAITDVVTDMRNANHGKEIHVFVASYGGAVHALNMIFQQLLEFRHRVGVNMGMADSCGWMLMFACQERYGSPFCDFMYHEMSGGSFGKVAEARNQNEFATSWWRELLKRTDTEKVLTKEEMKLGETSEVWLTGAELIRRGAMRDYSEYLKRGVIQKATDMYRVGERLFRRDGDEFVEYVPDNNSRGTYQEMVDMQNGTSGLNRNAEKPEEPKEAPKAKRTTKSKKGGKGK